ncbi:helix-hairpin-helix domain-containing protein [Aeromicrobium sp. CF3.5]|uniref:helix-hairpin-helix domain-containing protein n=1 Tax=Aeromicrobium sp. CF3.5 TaxID=3373078 RepID=UPI003EE55F86
MRSEESEPSRPEETRPEETRAEVARRRLAELAASFEAEVAARAAEAEPAVPVAPVDVAPAEVDVPASRGGTRRARATVPRVARVSAAHLRVVGALGVAAVVVLGALLLSGRPEASEDIAPLSVSGDTAAGSREEFASGSADQPAELVIDVIGEVATPGIVTVPRGSRVYEAIEAAGGLDGKVDTSGVNLARVLEDGEQIIVGPAPEVAAGTGGAPSGTGATGAKISLNRATVEQLDTLPGVGPVTAAAIIAWRDENGSFSSVEDLLDVTGIGDVTFAELRDLVTP